MQFEDEKEDTVNVDDGFWFSWLDQQEPSIIFGDDDSEVNKTSHDMEDAVDGETDFFPDSYREWGSRWF